MKVITAIIVIGILTAFALYMGINGAVYMSSIAIIGGLGGYAVHRKAKRE